MNKWMKAFFASEMAGGVAMLTTALIALVLANTALNDVYHDLIHTPLISKFNLHYISHDMLMPIFFLLVGMELKYEMLSGALSQPRQRVLPLFAAVGGIAFPALIYMAITHDTAGLGNGWAIPTATDIAFAICIINLAGRSVPAAAKVFLLAIAIYDDLAAILIIALFYSGSLDMVPLLGAAAVALTMGFMNRRNIGQVAQYLLLGIALGFLLYKAGIHTTVAGMITGLCIPLKGNYRGKNSPLESLMHDLHPLVAFGVLPLFAFSSAGVSFEGLSLGILLEPLPLGIALGLFFGKQLGIFGVTYIAAKSGFAPPPKGASWYTIYGISLIAGIGFTMSLFIGQLAFSNELLQTEMKLGVMAGSLLSAVVGLAVLKLRPAVT